MLDDDDIDFARKGTHSASPRDSAELFGVQDEDFAPRGTDNSLALQIGQAANRAFHARGRPAGEIFAAHRDRAGTGLMKLEKRIGDALAHVSLQMANQVMRALLDELREIPDDVAREMGRTFEDLEEARLLE